MYDWVVERMGSALSDRSLARTIVVEEIVFDHDEPVTAFAAVGSLLSVVMQRRVSSGAPPGMVTVSVNVSCPWTETKPARLNVGAGSIVELSLMVVPVFGVPGVAVM
jgi:hypothetical protein